MSDMPEIGKPLDKAIAEALGDAIAHPDFGQLYRHFWRTDQPVPGGWTSPARVSTDPDTAQRLVRWLVNYREWRIGVNHGVGVQVSIWNRKSILLASAKNASEAAAIATSVWHALQKEQPVHTVRVRIRTENPQFWRERIEAELRSHANIISRIESVELEE